LQPTMETANSTKSIVESLRMARIYSETPPSG
jgi:hypothetical protein